MGWGGGNAKDANLHRWSMSVNLVFGQGCQVSNGRFLMKNGK